MMIYILLPLVLLVFADQSINAAKTALRIWCMDVVPSLFPYMVLSRLVSIRLRDKGVPAVVCVPLLGLLGGSPSGASAIAGYASHITHAQLHALCALSGTISPMFFLGTLSRWYGNIEFARMLLTAHFGGALFCSCIVYAFMRKKRGHTTHQLVSAHPAGIDDPIQQCISAILNIGASIMLFSVAAGLFSAIPGIPTSIRAGIHALLEAAGGIHELSQLSLSKNAHAFAAAAAAGFGGISILFQNLTFLRPIGIQIRQLTAYGVIRSIASVFIMLILVLVGKVL